MGGDARRNQALRLEAASQAAFFFARFFVVFLTAFLAIFLAAFLADFLAFVGAFLPVRYSPTFFDECPRSEERRVGKECRL